MADVSALSGVLTHGATTELTVESLLYELCAAVAICRPSRLASRRGSRVSSAVQRGFTTGVSLSAMADDVGVHPSHLCRAFHRFRGRSIGDYVVGLRMQLACRRVVETDWPLADVAAEAGFSDQSHMTRTFKRLLGIAPGAYRRTVREPFSAPQSEA